MLIFMFSIDRASEQDLRADNVGKSDAFIE
jgi:hypothetical protein